MGDKSQFFPGRLAGDKKCNKKFRGLSCKSYLVLMLNISVSVYINSNFIFIPCIFIFCKEFGNSLL